MNRFAGKTIIITGATSGIGRSLALKLAEKQANLVLISRSSQKLIDLKSELTQFGSSDIQIFTADLSNRQSTRDVFQTIIRDKPIIDALINNAGVGVFEYAHLTKQEDVDQMFQLNVYSIIEALTVMIPFFNEQGYGHIINIASFAGKLSTTKSAVYSATKAAVLAYSNATRLEFESKNLFLTTVNLGPVKTNFFKQADPDGHYQQSISDFMLNPEKVANKICKFLFKRKREINLPWWMAIGDKLHYQFPRLSEKIFANQFKRK